MDRKQLNLEDISLSEEYFERIEAGQWSNQILAEFCDTLAEFEEDSEVANKWRFRATDLRYCNKTLIWNHYIQQSLKDFQRTFKCHDRFCPLCAKDVANSREQRFSGALEVISGEYDLYHLTLTLPNCRGSVAPWELSPKIQKMQGLTETIKAIQKGFKRFIDFLDSKIHRKKIAGVDFAQYGFAGAIRSLEITFKEDQTYHAHYHVILALKKDLQLQGENVNKFSWDKFTDDFHPFTDLEVLIQKVWYLILNDITVTKKAIDELQLGYSCHMRKVDKDDCHEAFKYAVKPDEQQNMTLEVFQDLHHALYKKRVVETYGVFRKYKISDETIDESFDAFYDALVKAWQSVEAPVTVSESATEARENIKRGNCIYASRKSIRAFIRRLGLDEELPVIVAEPKRVQEFAQMVMELPAALKQSKRPKRLDADERRFKKSKAGDI